MSRTNPRVFMEMNFPELKKYKSTTSRMWERQEKTFYYDNWWFKFFVEDLSNHDFIIFIGAKDYSDRDFKVFKVPSSYIVANLSKLDKTAKGWMNLYIHMTSLSDLRNDAGLPFRQFALN